MVALRTQKATESKEKKSINLIKKTLWINFNHPKARYNQTSTAPMSDGAQGAGPGKKQERSMDLPREDHRLVALACHSLSWDSASPPRGTGHRGFRDARESGLGGMDLGLLACIQIQRLVPRASPSKWDGGMVWRGRSHEGLMESLALGIGLWTYLLVRACSNSCRSGYL